MMCIVSTEITRLRYLWWLLPLLLIAQLLSIGLLEPNNYKNDGYGEFTPVQYRQLIRDIETGIIAPDDVSTRHDEINAYNNNYLFGTEHESKIPEPDLRYTDNRYSEEALYKHILSDINSSVNYHVFLQEVQDAAQRLSNSSLFSNPDGYTQRAVIKTAEVYSSLFSINPQWSNPSGARVAINPEGIGWLELLGIMAFAIPLMTGTQPIQMLLCSTHRGRQPLLTARLLIMVGFTAVLTLVLTLCGVLYGHCYYGIGDLSRPIQAVFQESPWHVSVGGAILAQLGLRCLFSIFLAVPIAALFHTIRNIPACVGVTAVTIAAGVLCYTAIPGYSWVCYFKWVNPYGLLHTEEAFLFYRCVNIFGRPVTLLWSICVTGFIFTALSSAAVLLYAEKASVDRGRVIFNLSIFNCGAKQKKANVSIFLHELRRLLFGYRVIILLVCIIAVSVIMCRSFPPSVYPEEAEYRRVVESLVGLPADERMDTVLASLADNPLPRREAALRRVESHLHYLSNNTGGMLLYDSGWKYLLCLTEQAREAYYVCTVILIIGTTLCISPIREQDAHLLLQTTEKGRGDLTCRKLLLAGLIGLIVTICAYFPILWHSLKSFGLPFAGAASLSLQELAGSTLQLWMTGFMTFSLVAAFGIVISIALYAVSRFGIRTAIISGTSAAVLCLLFR